MSLDLLDALLDHVYPEGLPELLEAVMDRELTAKYLDDSKIGFGFRSDEDGNLHGGVMIRDVHETAAFRDRLIEALPETGVYVSSYGSSSTMVLDLLSRKKPRILVIKAQPKGDLVGYVLGIDEDRSGSLVIPQDDHVPPTLPAALEGARKVGDWIAEVRKDKVRRMVWSLDGPQAREWIPRLMQTPEGAALKDLCSIVERAGHRPHPFAWIGGRRSQSAVMWGHSPGRPHLGSYEDTFQDEPGADDVAEAFTKGLPQETAGQVSAHVRAAAGATLGHGGAEALPELWSWMAGLRLDTPTDALAGRFAKVAAGAALPGWEARALDLALTRYLLGHHHLDATCFDHALPEEAAGWSEADVLSQANELLERVRTHAQAVSEDDDVAWAVPGVSVDLPSVIHTLHRAIDGDFSSAQGRLHGLLEAAGPGAFDDDPDAVALADVDLDPEAREAALDALLALGEDAS